MSRPLKHQAIVVSADTPVGANNERLADHLRKNIVKDDAGCQLYRSGMERIRIKDRTYMVGRIRYVLKNGTFPQNWVLYHDCGNRKCVNPDHMTAVHRKELATRSAGMRGHKDNKVSKALAHEIKVALRQGVSRQELSYKHQLTYSTIRSIDLGKHWTLRT